jgi:uncharacterized membrane protein
MKSPQALIVMIMGIIMSIIGTFKYSPILMIIQFVSFYIIADTIECKVYGGCVISSWISVILPALIFIVFLMDIFKVFKDFRNNLKQKYRKWIK